MDPTFSHPFTCNPCDKFTQIHDSLIRSKAFADLSHSGKIVLVLLIAKWNRWTVGGKFSNTEKHRAGIPFTVKHVRPFGVSSTSFWRASKELEAAGFIHINRFRGYSNRWRPIHTWKRVSYPVISLATNLNPM